MQLYCFKKSVFLQ